MTVADLPQLPLVCLRTADSKDTQQVVSGKPTIIGTSVMELWGVGLSPNFVPTPKWGMLNATHLLTVVPPCFFFGVETFRLLDDSVYTMS